MKMIKKWFMGLSVLLILLCAGILILALSPELTGSLSKLLYGDKDTEGMLSGFVEKSEDTVQPKVSEDNASKESVTVGKTDSITPLEWGKDPVSDAVFVSGGDTYDRNQANLTEDMIQPSLKAYYENCLLQMTDRGAGQQSFSNVVPKYVLDQLEREYGTGDYWDAYVKSGLQKIGKEHFAIQLQIQDLGGNYYRVYHNINTW